MRNNKVLQRVLIFLGSFFTTFALAIDLDKKNIVVDTNNVNLILMLFLVIVLSFLYSKFYFKKTKQYPCFIILALVFALFMVFGYSFKMLNSWYFVFGKPIFIFISIIKMTGFFLLFNMVIHKIYEKLPKINKEISIKNRFVTWWDKHPFRNSIIVIILAWLPYIISFYPAILSPDPSFQIKQFFGIETKYMEYAEQIDSSVTITNHHPVAHTVLLGGSAKLGHILFDSTNIGLFIYSIIQISILVSALAFSLNYMKKMQTPLYLRLIVLAIYCLVPMFPLYSMSAVKDVIFGALLLIYMIYLYDGIKNRNENIYTWKRIVGIMILLLGIMLVRNNGIYTIILSLPFLLLIDKKNRLKIICIILAPVIVYKSYTNILLPALKITDGSIREMLSIPFQQTARYVRDHGDEITTEEYEIYDKVLDMDDLAERYNPDLSDPVKGKYNPKTTDEELKTYFKTWFSGLFKHPNTYIQATINNVYGYFYPDKTNWYIYYKYDKRLSQEGDTFNYKYNGLSIPRKVLSNYGLAFPYIPGVGLLVNIAFNVWMYLTMIILLIRKRDFKNIICFMPFVSLILVCIASPANTYFRYAIPYVFALPTIFMIFLDMIKERSEKNER